MSACPGDDVIVSVDLDCDFLIQKLLAMFPEEKMSHEYEDYRSDPTKDNASEGELADDDAENVAGGKWFFW